MFGIYCCKRFGEFLSFLLKVELFLLSFTCQRFNLLHIRREFIWIGNQDFELDWIKMSCFLLFPSLSTCKKFFKSSWTCCARDVKLNIMQQVQPHCFMGQCFSCFEDPKSEKYFHDGNSHVGSMELWILWTPYHYICGSWCDHKSNFCSHGGIGT